MKLKNNSYSSKLLLVLHALFSLSISKESKIELTIEVSNINLHKKGLLRVGIFDQQGFPQADKAIAGKIIHVTDSKMIVPITLKASGTYAVCVVHDQDKNGKLSKNIVGYPTEPYGFSNNKYGRLGPPAFQDVSFSVKDEQKLKVIIKLND